MKHRSIAIYNKSMSGHRAAYMRYISDIFKCRQVGKLRTFGVSNPVLFLMIEDSFALYVIVALFRSLLGRRTVGLLFRPGPAAEGATLRLRIKRMLLKMLKILPAVRTLTIIPFSIAPHFRNIADDGIYDLQLWDFASEAGGDLLASHSVSPPADLVDIANGRRVISTIGAQNVNKGYDVFTSVWHANQDLHRHVLFASGGKVAPSLSAIGRRFELEAGFSVNRFISDEELLGFYSHSDLIWCYYSSDYDQASGVLGRAIQFGIPVIVRPGSLSHKFCVSEGVPHISVAAKTLAAELAKPFPVRNPRGGVELASKFRKISLATLQAALGVRKSAP
ncbi:hypothetical protein LH128_31650 [Sphingomonas sp. LH128]|uniref:hypothetical protein n=1 Tax=Sphingomonas sp. LH128 TaxID=473781 RepID=UPI00027CA4BD|nr:hypothetical protein [Sphingomonas sp. LH128]EJU08912.1 hypothetical protein LH128_31650 [Sphingomonas sp. LH128]